MKGLTAVLRTAVIWLVGTTIGRAILLVLNEGGFEPERWLSNTLGGLIQSPVATWLLAAAFGVCFLVAWELLFVGKKLRETAFPRAPKGWDLPLEKKFRINFKNETVAIDGFEFIECTFDSVTFKYQGRRSFRFTKCRGRNSARMTTDNPVVGQTIVLQTIIRGDQMADFEIFKVGDR